MVMRLIAKAFALALLALAFAANHANAHPLHSTITELAEDRAHGIVRATIRVFADDFGTAVGRMRKSGGAPELAYVSTVFGFTDRSGHTLQLKSCGTRRTGDLLWICVEASSAEGLSALKVRNGMLSELFDDQVNVVQGTIGGARRSLLFTKGDAPKAISG
jgi:hypothetical protein